MAIKEKLNGDLTIIECDHCGREFRADRCIHDRWEYRGQYTGRHDYSSWTEQDLCAPCAREALGKE